MVDVPDLSGLVVRHTSHRASERMGPWVEEAIHAAAVGEDVVWEGQLMPTPDGGAAWGVFVWMKGAVLGTFAQGSFMIHDPIGMTEERTKATVAEFMRQLKEARSQQLEEQTPKGHRNGLGLIT